MKHIHRRTLAIFLISALSVGFGAFPAFSQVGPRGSRGTQLGRDPGRPMIAVCPDAQPCQFVGLVDPGGVVAGALILDSGYFAVCTPGSCAAPAPFAVTPAFLAGTSVAAAAGGLGPAAVGAIVAASVAVVGGAVGGALASGGNEVKTGSQ